MRTLRTKLSSLVVLAGIAAIAAGSSAASAAGGPVCGTKADGPKSYDSAAAAKADGAKVAHMGGCVILCQGFAPTLMRSRCAAWIRSTTPG